MTAAYQMVTVHPVQTVKARQMAMLNSITAVFVKVEMRKMIVMQMMAA